MNKILKKKEKLFDNKQFDIYKFLKTRPLSYSALNSFADPQYGSPEKWYKTYILGERQSSAELTFGSKIDKLIQDDSTFCPTLPRYPLMQYQMDVIYNKKIPMTGKPDGLCLDTFLLADFKTGKASWTQSRADETDQLTAYLFFIYIKHKISPEKFRCFIHWLPTKKVEHGNFDVEILFRDKNLVPITFETKRTMQDLLKFGEKVNETVLAMQEYVRNHE